jgi:hypothetical protein
VIRNVSKNYKLIIYNIIRLITLTTMTMHQETFLNNSNIMKTLLKKPQHD